MASKKPDPATKKATSRQNPVARRRAGAKTPTLGGAVPNRAEIEVRRREVVQMVINGVPLAQIAERYQVTTRTIQTDYRRGLADLYGAPADEVAAFRAEITERERMIIARFFPLAIGKPGEAPNHEAAAVVLRADRLLSKIWGLESTTVINLIGNEREDFASLFSKLDEALIEATATETSPEAIDP